MPDLLMRETGNKGRQKLNKNTACYFCYKKTSIVTKTKNNYSDYACHIIIDTNTTKCITIIEV